MSFLRVENLTATIGGTEILKDFSISIEQGESHAIMGINGSGKSTLSKAIAGHPDVEILKGNILFQEQSILELEIEERAALGIFIGFQYPVEIPGVNNMHFLRTAVNSIRTQNNQPEVSASDFLKEVRSVMKEIDMNPDLINRHLNSGFSGGEKKRNEIIQLKLLKPRIAILDEIDSGLDIDALKSVATGINSYKNSENSIILITHYQRLLEQVKPDFVHIMIDGAIQKTGDYKLALELEELGYESIMNQGNIK